MSERQTLILTLMMRSSALAPVMLEPPAWSTTVGSIMHLLAKGGQRIETAVCLHPNIATTAPVAACWPTC